MKLENILTEKRIIVALSAIGLLAVLFLLPLRFLAVHAQTETFSGSDEAPAPMVIEADDVGNVVIRGQVTSVDDNSLTINSWGGEWTIRTTVSSTVEPATGVSGNLSGIRSGDFVGVEGVFATDEEMTINASFVRDWTTNPLIGVFDNDSDSITTDTSVDDDDVSVDAEDTSTADIITYSGIVDQVDDSSFTFTDDFGSVYTVTVDDEVAVVNDSNEIRELEDIDAGDTVELDGTATSNNFITTAMVKITSE